MNRYILGILKKTAKCSDSRQTEVWTESKKEMISILTMKIQKIKVDQHFKDVEINDFHMGIHSMVSWFSFLSVKKTHIILTVARMTETKNAINFPSICVAYSFWSSSQWEWFSAYH